MKDRARPQLSPLGSQVGRRGKRLFSYSENDSCSFFWWGSREGFSFPQFPYIIRRLGLREELLKGYPGPGEAEEERSRERNGTFPLFILPLLGLLQKKLDGGDGVKRDKRERESLLKLNPAFNPGRGSGWRRDFPLLLSLLLIHF